jgi:hypothetical protein
MNGPANKLETLKEKARHELIEYAFNVSDPQRTPLPVPTRCDAGGWDQSAAIVRRQGRSAS